MSEQPLRLTRQRQAVADVLATLDDFRSAQEIHEAAAPSRATPSASPPSTAPSSCSPSTTRSTCCVGRDGEASYRRCSGTHHHHLVCRDVRRHRRGRGARPSSSGPAASPSEHGYADVSHTLEIFGDLPALPLRALSEPAAASTLSGSRTRNTLPRPTSLSTSIRPPWLSTIDFVIESPRPTPWMLCSSACRVRKKRVNSWSRSRASIPMPVSSTQSSARSPSRPSRTVDPAAARGVLQGVRDQVVGDLPHPVAVEQHLQRLAGAPRRASPPPRSPAASPRRPCRGRSWRGRPGSGRRASARGRSGRSAAGRPRAGRAARRCGPRPPASAPRSAGRSSLHEQVDVAADRGERGAQLVGHRGHELVLDPQRPHEVGDVVVGEGGAPEACRRRRGPTAPTPTGRARSAGRRRPRSGSRRTPRPGRRGWSASPRRCSRRSPFSSKTSPSWPTRPGARPGRRRRMKSRCRRFIDW